VKELIFLKLFISLDKEAQVRVREKLCEALRTLFHEEEKKSLVRLMLKLMTSDDHVSSKNNLFSAKM